MKPVIAIDGPAGSGKGTLARMIASHFSLIYLDTGLLYRTIAYLDLSLDEMKDLTINTLLDEISKLTDKELRSDENSVKASNVAKLPEIRNIMTRLQRDFIEIYKDQGVVLDGRDIGTVVVPDACCKLFITADLQERAKRRFKTLKDQNVSFEEVYNNMKLRDDQDKSREVAPLTFDETYIIIDTSKHSEEESFKICKKEIEKHLRVLKGDCLFNK